MPQTDEEKKLDSEYMEYLNKGYSFWNSYTVKPEADRAIKHLTNWGSKVKVFHYPNGVYVILERSPRYNRNK